MMSAPPAKMADITANALAVNLIAILITILVAGGAVVGAWLLPHAVPMGRLDLVWCLVGLVALGILHEFLHACALMRYAHIPWKSFKFGILWRQLVLYCHCRQSATIGAFRYCALAPLTILGSLTVLATLLYPATWLALVTGVHLSGCTGDVWIFLRLRRFPAHFLYLDSPDKIGGEVFEPAKEFNHDSAPAEKIMQ